MVAFQAFRVCRPLKLLNRTIRHADLAMLCAAPLLRGISSIPMRISSEQAVLGHNSSRAMCTASESELRQVLGSLNVVEAQLQQCAIDVIEVEKEVKAAADNVLTAADTDERLYWRKEKEQLRKKEEQLRKEKERIAKERTAIFYRSLKEIDLVIDGEAVRYRVDRLTWEKRLQQQDAPHGLRLAECDRAPVVFGFDELESGKAYKVLSEKERRQLGQQPTVLSFSTRATAEDGSIIYQPATAEVWSERDFKELFKPGHQLWASGETEPSRRIIQTLEQARSLPAEANLVLEADGDLLMRSVGNLQGFVKNHSSGIEHQTTKAMARDASLIREFGDLELVNDGRAVTFFDAKTRMKRLEVDGMVLNTSVLLVNESKMTPQVSDAASAAGKLPILRDILRRPSEFISEPPGILQAVKGVEQIVGVLSGVNFTSEVVDACADNSLRALRTNGEGYSVSE
mmetsp:Transcript_41435/g.103013  ORF Transcript_41435/g.103013 Transcript_41435/m.103013 type:complete len:457 (-) Transcript_41435:392-1762(-)